MLIILNPKAVHFALFIGAVGLDIFQMPIDVQIPAVIGTVLKYYIKPIQTYLK